MDLLDLLYPPKCIFCGALLEKKKGKLCVCPSCLNELPRTENRDIPTLQGVDRLFVPLRYEGKVRFSLLDLKFSYRSANASSYAALIAPEINKDDFDLITCVPVSRRTRRKRGFDQSELIAGELSKLTGIPFSKLLFKRAKNKVQSTLSTKEERQENVRGVFKARTGTDLSGKNILLVDDIVTTGATVSECSAVLRNAGASSVSVCALALA